MERFVVARPRTPVPKPSAAARPPRARTTPARTPPVIVLPDTYAHLLVGGELSLWQPLSEKHAGLEREALAIFDPEGDKHAAQAAELRARADTLMAEITLLRAAYGELNKAH